MGGCGQSIQAEEAVCANVLMPQKVGAYHEWDSVSDSISHSLGAAILHGSSPARWPHFPVSFSDIYSLIQKQLGSPWADGVRPSFLELQSFPCFQSVSFLKASISPHWVSPAFTVCPGIFCL